MKNLLLKHSKSFNLIWVMSFFFTLIMYFTWTLDRGFEITDESYYLLLSMHPSAVKLFNSAQHWFTSLFWIFTGSLYLFRASGLILLLFTASILAWGAIHSYKIFTIGEKITNSEKAIIYACTLSGAILYGATINFSPCYNLLAASASYAVVGLVLMVTGSPTKYKIVLIYFLSGSIMGIAILNKFSSGFTIMCLVFILIAILGNNTRSKIFEIIILLVGMITTLLIFILLHMRNGNVIDEFQFGMAVFKMVQTESTIARLLRYVYEFSSQMFRTGAFLLAPLIFLTNFTKTPNIKRYKRYAIFSVILLGCIFLPKAFTISRWVAITDFLLIILVISLIITLNTWAKNIKVASITIGLIFIPYFVAFGTGNPINTQIIVSLGSWGTVISILVIINKGENYSKGLYMFLCSIFVSGIIFLVAIGSFSPYHLNASIWDQKFKTKIGNIGTVKTDRITKEFIDSVSFIKQRHIHDLTQPYLGFYGLPGIALILNVVPLYSPWLTFPQQSEFMFDRVDQDILQSSIIGILLQKDGTMPPLPGQFISFPANYSKVGELNCPYANQRLQFWIPNK